MHDANFQYRNNDPSENVEVNFTGSDGVRRVLSFVATRPHWCEEKDIFGDLFSSPLEAVFEGAVFPLIPGSGAEEAAIRDFRFFVESAIPDYATLQQRRRESEWRDRYLVWFLTALERRRSRFVRPTTELGAPPSGGPAEPSGDSSIGSEPPSVS